LKVKIQYFASVRELVNLREETVDIPAGANVRNLLDLLTAKYGNKLKEYLLDGTGNPREYLQFLLNEKSISQIDGFATLLRDGSTIAIIPPVGGG
jgi:MoaD family protein